MEDLHFHRQIASRYLLPQLPHLYFDLNNGLLRWNLSFKGDPVLLHPMAWPHVAT